MMQNTANKTEKTTQQIMQLISQIKKYEQEVDILSKEEDNPGIDDSTRQEIKNKRISLETKIHWLFTDLSDLPNKTLQDYEIILDSFPGYLTTNPAVSEEEKKNYKNLQRKEYISNKINDYRRIAAAIIQFYNEHNPSEPDFKLNLRKVFTTTRTEFKCFACKQLFNIKDLYIVENSLIYPGKNNSSNKKENIRNIALGKELPVDYILLCKKDFNDYNKFLHTFYLYQQNIENNEILQRLKAKNQAVFEIVKKIYSKM
ncbi:MAG: hypothetical protein QXX01_03325 [Candidatus Aenigmatarchaeota archaeon]